MTVPLDHSAQVDLATGRAEDFLLAAQDADGGWRDFLLPAGLSDSWVTGYVAAALIESGDAAEPTVAAARRAWSFLHGTESPQGGWSYNPKVPGDADSTLWGLRLAQALGEGESELARRATVFLDAHVQADHGLSTYAAAAPIRAYTGLPDFVPFDGWTQSHVCVSAAGANLVRYSDRLLTYLLERQDADGSWPAYFWFDREYSTGEAVDALAAAAARAGTPAAELGPAIERATAWLTRRVTILAAAEGRVRPAFALACAARALARVARTGEARRAVARAGASLAAWQRENGSWGPSARLRVPAPDTITPREDSVWSRWQGIPATAASPVERLAATFNNFSPDHRGLFGAAASLRALRRIAGRRAS